MLRLWILWSLLTVIAGLALASRLPTSESTSEAATTFLPGETTHGHHQIEMKCAACHDPGGSVREQACLDCHQADLKAVRDTHPRTKFIDPTKAVLLEKVDATNCLTCHTEHVPERTHGAGVTLPRDYCIECHDTIADDRPSHAELGFDTCTNVGCHNFHDNTTLNENFLRTHLDEDELLANAVRLLAEERDAVAEPLTIEQADVGRTPEMTAIFEEWAASGHATAGVNCTACHRTKDDGGGKPDWSDHVGRDTCRTCHESEVEGFLGGLHGLRLGVGLPAMQPVLARLPMKHDSLHRELNCQSCHPAHRDDTRYAAVEACLGCHDDDHSRAYEDSVHHDLWLAELSGEAAVGTGVSCATCHMPRVETSRGAKVQHNQSANLEPVTKMASVCGRCHGLQFTLDSLADPELGDRCYGGRPTDHVDSLEMVRRWFEKRGR